MKNVADFQIAKDLFDAGFPQPSEAVGQFWWVKVFEGGTAEYDALCIVCSHKNNSSQSTLFLKELETNMQSTSILKNFKAVFAPTALDICLDETPFLTVMQHGDGEYYAGKVRRNGFATETSNCETAVEAAAKAWIKRRKNENTNAIISAMQ